MPTSVEEAMSPSDQVEVAVVVVTYNSAELVDPLLDSLPEALAPHSYRVVVVDNDSQDDTVAVLARRTDDVTLVEQSNLGYSAGINAGADVVPGAETILVLNPDVRLEAGSVAHLLRRLRSSGAGIVAPRVLDEDGSTAWSLRREPSLPRALGLSRMRRPVFSEHVQEPRAYERPHVVAWAVGAVLLVDRRVHDALGGWDDSYFLYSEETDFCLRASDAGFTTFYEPAARAVHIGGGSGRSPRTEAMQALNRVRLYARRHPWPAGVAYYLLMVVSELRRVLSGDRAARECLRCLLSPRRRPPQLGMSDRLVPR